MVRSSSHAATVAIALLGSSSAQAPGNGISKAAYAASTPLNGLSFLLRYLPVTAAQDSCPENYCACGGPVPGPCPFIQGRCQLLVDGPSMNRTCIVGYSSDTTLFAAAEASAVTGRPAANSGDDCTYESGQGLYWTNSGSVAHAAFAHDPDTCCKACAADALCSMAPSAPSGEASQDDDQGPRRRS